MIPRGPFISLQIYDFLEDAHKGAGEPQVVLSFIRASFTADFALDLCFLSCSTNIRKYAFLEVITIQVMFLTMLVLFSSRRKYGLAYMESPVLTR